ncbi:putative 26S proteasome regulatory subunit rpn9 [Wickerhamiella sorbophila]|uniref:Putative 26S proteasome regulatory subunit rpn9 n=1 Tax=Wickerhamiella sorbophila TaxID=45607 RepID=A0A2T0FPH5_9ASCO|nr:putative 26S proteasome regulatory subunit rpn9 [Wickerhamiella sorbophila]PRT56891.1 putative 26S proteasome regulatory subunit rpn9 [Wickerhamiella sorbophila]
MPDALTAITNLRMQVTDEQPELVEQIYELEDLHERKLWHQLTQKVVELFADERSRLYRHQLFTQFLATVEDKINPLAYVSLGISASELCATPQESIVFLQKICDKVEDENVRKFAELRIASYCLQTGEVPRARKIIDSASKLVDELQTTDSTIMAMYYGVSCEYYKHKREYTAYYRNALLYLACIDINTLSREQQQQKAYDLAVAALLGDKIYNFGELILHPIAQTLDGEYKWLHDLVFAVNSGDIVAFQNIKPSLEKAPIVQSSIAFLDQKICLMALCECVFKRPTTDRVLPFDAIATETKLQTGSKVEILVLKALSLGLIEGTIDQVDKTVTVTWLQPRVLSNDQIAVMRSKLGDWDREVNTLVDWMQTEGKQVWAQTRA